MTAKVVTAPMYLAGTSALLPHMKPTRKSLATVAFVTFVATMLALTWTMHQRANAAPVDPTWQQSVVTVDDARTAQLAQQWGAPFEVRFVEQGADIRVKDSALDDMVGGEATKAVDGDRITGCQIVRERASEVVTLHELGHCFGLHHDDGHSDSLMYWIQGGASGAPGVTATDRAALAALYSEVK